jgi:hypothetical protein
MIPEVLEVLCFPLPGFRTMDIKVVKSIVQLPQNFPLV